MAKKRSKKRISIKQIKAQVSMEELLLHLGGDIPNWAVRNEDGWRSVHCPLHENEKPSGRYLDGEDDDGNPVGKYMCYSCGFGFDNEEHIGGDQIDLVIAAEQAEDVHSAAGWLVNQFNLQAHVAKGKPRRSAEPISVILPEGWTDSDQFCPDDWPPVKKWAQDHWAQFVERWMPVARAAIAPRDERQSLSSVYKRLKDHLDEVDAVLRKCIWIAAQDYVPKKAASFDTFLQLVVRRRIIDWLRREIRWDRLGIVLDPEDPRSPAERATTTRGGLKQLRVPSDEPQWAKIIDWQYLLAACELDLGMEYALFAYLRGIEELSEREIAKRLGVTRRQVRQIEQVFRAWYRSAQGREVAAFREAAGEAHTR